MVTVSTQSAYTSIGISGVGVRAGKTSKDIDPWIYNTDRAVCVDLFFLFFFCAKVINTWFRSICVQNGYCYYCELLHYVGSIHQMSNPFCPTARTRKFDSTLQLNCFMFVGHTLYFQPRRPNMESSRRSASLR